VILNMQRLSALGAATVMVCALATPARAQTPTVISLDAVFFGDNAEFFSPFRTGETILGSWQRLNVDMEIGAKASLRLGLYSLERDGSDRRSEVARPVAALTMGTSRHRFIFGTLETGDRSAGIGPDRTTPHALLPPLAIETDWFSRAYEAGLQWKTNVGNFTQDVWFDYQKIITSEHRELFDGGVVGRYQPRPATPVSLVYQFHVVHHGGQQFHVGPVSDSFGYGPGILLRREIPEFGTASLEFYTLFSYDRPDRQHPEQTVQGNAILLRGAAERSSWRGHFIVWSAKDFKHEAGDPNYLSQLPDGTGFHDRRTYAEMGLALLFRPAPTVNFEASGRAHVVQGRWGYSYRVLGTLHFDIWRTALSP
jgi:hypothetical protein